MSTRVPFRTLALAALLLVPPVAGGCSSLISREQEIAMGEQAAPELEKEFGGRVDDEQLQTYVSMIGGEMAKAAVSDRDMPYDFTLVRSDVPNAFALPGGKIFLTAGLMTRMSSERELAAVLGHEVGHVAAKHNVKGMQRQMGAEILIAIAAQIAGADKAEAAKMATQVATAMVNLKYSRDDEHEADEYGVRYLYRGKRSPWGMPELLTVLLNLSGPDAQPGALATIFQTHPPSQDRIDRTAGIIRDDDRYRTFDPKTPDPNQARFLRMRALLRRRLPNLK